MRDAVDDLPVILDEFHHHVGRVQPYLSLQHRTRVRISVEAARPSVFNKRLVRCLRRRQCDLRLSVARPEFSSNC